MAAVFILIFISTFALLLAENRRASIFLISAQGFLAAVAYGYVSNPLFTIFALIPIKAILIPAILYKASQKPEGGFECIGKRFYYAASLIPFSIAACLFSLHYKQNAIGIAASFGGVFAGLLLIVFARSLRTQFVGMISLENGISCAMALYTSSLFPAFEIPLILDLVLLAVVFFFALRSIYQEYPQGNLSDFKTLKG